MNDKICQVIEDEDGVYLVDVRTTKILDADELIRIGTGLVKFAELNADKIKERNERTAVLFTNISKIAEGKHKCGFVYVLKCGPFYKVGASKDVEHRVAQLDHRPFKIELVAKSKCVEDYFQYEHEILSWLDQYNISGEWFNLPEKVAAYLITHVTEIE